MDHNTKLNMKGHLRNFTTVLKGVQNQKIVQGCSFVEKQLDTDNVTRSKSQKFCDTKDSVGAVAQ